MLTFVSARGMQRSNTLCIRSSLPTPTSRRLITVLTVMSEYESELTELSSELTELSSELTELSSELTELSDNPEPNHALTVAASVHSSSSFPARARTLSDRASSPVPRPRVLGHRSTAFPHPPLRDVWTDNDATLIENDEEMGYADDEDAGDEARRAPKNRAKRRRVAGSDEEDDSVASPTHRKKSRLNHAHKDSTATASTLAPSSPELRRSARARKIGRTSKGCSSHGSVRSRSVSADETEHETDTQSGSENADHFKFTYLPAFPFADPEKFPNVVQLKFS